MNRVDLKYTFVLRRSSSLYMQSMVFPAVLLTTVALLGFFLPPDSGERIGLQITILLTFMVFLLTVGEMFPASTGPFLGVYYILCMVLLGINLFMTVLVLHLHYMSSAAAIGVTKDGKRFIKNVPRWAILLLRIAKYEFSKDVENTGRDSPTSNVVMKIIRNGNLSSKISSSEDEHIQTGMIPKSFHHNERPCRTTNSEFVISTRKNTIIPIMNRQQVSPEKFENNDAREIESTETSVEDSAEFSKNEKTDSNQDDSAPPMNQNITSKMEEIKQYLKSYNDHLNDSNVCEDVENEWKAMARIVDKLCMKVYLAVLVISHVIILAIAFVRGTSYNHKG